MADEPDKNGEANEPEEYPVGEPDPGVLDYEPEILATTPAPRFEPEKPEPVVVQFSMRRMFLVIAAVALAIGLMYSVPNPTLVKVIATVSGLALAVALVVLESLKISWRGAIATWWWLLLIYLAACLVAVFPRG